MYDNVIIHYHTLLKSSRYTTSIQRQYHVQKFKKRRIDVKTVVVVGKHPPEWSTSDLHFVLEHGDALYKSVNNDRYLMFDQGRFSFSICQLILSF